MRPRWVWVGACAVAVALLLLLARTEARYLRFIDSLDEVETELTLAETAPDPADPQRILLRFELRVANRSELPVALEAYSVNVIIGEEHVSLQASETVTDIPQREARTFELVVPLSPARRQTYADAAEQGLALRLDGRARVRFDLENVALKAFYPIEKSFPLGGAQ